jgi:hypothetical protein
MVTTRAISGGTGCSDIPMAIADHVAAMCSRVSAVFLQTGHRVSYDVSSLKQCQWIACPHGISWLADRDENKSSWQTTSTIPWVHVHKHTYMCTPSNIMTYLDNWTCIFPPCNCDHESIVHQYTCHNHDNVWNSLDHQLDKIHNRDNGMALLHRTSTSCNVHSGIFRTEFHTRHTCFWKIWKWYKNRNWVLVSKINETRRSHQQVNVKIQHWYSNNNKVVCLRFRTLSSKAFTTDNFLD